MAARNKNSTLIFALNFTEYVTLNFENDLSNELLPIQNRNKMLHDSLN